MRLPLGKMPTDVLEKYVLRVRGAQSRNVVVGPQLGVDFAAVRVGSKFLIISSDPVTGVLENAGWYAVNVSGNDVATSGTRPQFMELVILLPEGSSVETVNRTCSDVEDAAKNLGIAVVGGHTEVTPTLHRTIVVVTAFSLAEKFVTAAEAKLGDSILMTKTAGIEGTSILSGMFVDRLGDLDPKLISDARRTIRDISVIREATAAYETGYVHAMHDPTEGGVLGGVFEMAVASGLGFKIYEENVPVAPPTDAVCRRLNVDPIKLIGSGALMMAVDPKGVDCVKSRLSKLGIQATEIGRFEKRNRSILHSDGTLEEVEGGVLDELWRITGAVQVKPMRGLARDPGN